MLLLKKPSLCIPLTRITPSSDWESNILFGCYYSCLWNEITLKNYAKTLKRQRYATVKTTAIISMLLLQHYLLVVLLLWLLLLLLVLITVTVMTAIVIIVSILSQLLLLPLPLPRPLPLLFILKIASSVLLDQYFGHQFQIASISEPVNDISSRIFFYRKYMVR